MTKFDDTTLRRIQTSTRYTERVSKTSTPRQRRQPQIANQGKLVQITATNGSGKYSWIGLAPVASIPNPMGTNTDWGSGDYTETFGFAVEATGSTDVILNDVVRIFPAKSEDFYIFHYQPEVKFANLEDGDTISARSTSSVGSGDVTVQSYSGGSLTDTSQTLTVYNGFTKEVDGPRYITIEYSQSVWWITGADCDEYGA